MQTAATPAKELEQHKDAASDPTKLPEVPLSEEQEGEYLGTTFWDFMQSKPGQAITQQLLGIVHAIQRSTIEAQAEAQRQQASNVAEQQKEQVKFQHKTLHFWMWIQGIVFASCLIATVILA